MEFKTIVSQSIDASAKQFWDAMHIWLNNPHLVNRRISASINLLTLEIQSDVSQIINHLLDIQFLPNFHKAFSQGQSIEIALNIPDKCNFVKSSIDFLKTNLSGIYLLVDQWLPRNKEQFASGIEFSVVDKNLNCVLCMYHNIDDQKPLSLKNAYKISYSKDKLFSISVANIDDDSVDPSVGWLEDRLFPRLLKWTESELVKNDGLVEGSLKLVSPESYANLYDSLKRKYGLEMVKKWPECTDPNKFVYEDVAIATYLLLLWKEERIENGDPNSGKQSFVDLGCGNGLLVYILTSEGHSGVGIDLRKRKIWDIYPSTTHLEERTIVPSSTSLFPEADWLIGNHSDELTPWIPVIAARSSYKCRFFLLPCCAHEFDGRKFQRDSAAKSQYFEYLKYIKSVSEGCGFKTDLDKLRIPSTKRICLIGTKRNYPKDEIDSQDELIQKIIDARSLKGPKEAANDSITTEDQWSRNFKPREIVERVRNCTQLDKAVIDEIVDIVTSHLLLKARLISIEGKSEKTWNAGGQVELSELAKVIAPETLKQLKKECGGLQTLVRNNSHIFQVINGTVQFRVPGTAATSKKNKRRGKSNVQMKVKPCWFYANHPDGCPLSDKLCNFKH